ncbi:MAG: hypothetical protein KAR79_06090 [Simkaniaceae bacterium]|nr:hypothetical protein [Simkaniaceae bacterium]
MSTVDNTHLTIRGTSFIEGADFAQENSRRNNHLSDETSSANIRQAREASPFQRPQLPKSFQSALIHLVDGIEQTKSRSYELGKTRLELNAKDQQEIQEKRIANLQATALKAQSIGNWSFLQQIASTLFGAASVVTGMALISTGNAWVGGMMLGAGVTSTSSLILSEMGVDSRITGALALSSAAMSLLCGGLNFDQLANHLPALVTSIMSGAFNIANGVALFGKQYTESELTLLKAEKQDFSMLLAKAHKDSEEIQEDVKRASKQLTFAKEAANLLNDENREIIKILSTVA